MNRLVRTELRKLRTTRTTLAAMAAGPAVAVLVTTAVVTTAGTEGNAPLGPGTFADLLAAPASIITIVSLALGILGLAGEHRHRTLTATFLATPRRADVVRAKLAAHALAGAVLGLATVVTTAAVAWPWLSAEGVDVGFGWEEARLAVSLVVSAALHGALGVAIATLVRNQTVALAGVLVWLLSVEGALAVWTGRAGELLPAAAGAELVRPDGAPLLGALVLATYAGVLATVGTRFVVRRDVT